MKNCLSLLLMSVLLCGHTFAQPVKTSDPWAGWQFLLGDWVATGSGEPGEAVGHFSFSFDLDKKIIVRKNRADYPPRPGEARGFSHVDLLIVYPSPSDTQFRAIYFDNEGHCIICDTAMNSGEKPKRPT